MFFYTDTADAPWTVIRVRLQKRARLNALALRCCQTALLNNKDVSPSARSIPLLVGRANVVYERGEKDAVALL